LFAAGVVREERTGPEGDVLLLVELPKSELEALTRLPGVSAHPVTLAPTCAATEPYLESAALAPSSAA
jgi:hypothetical protein